MKFAGKVYKPVKFGEGLNPGTVEWERNRRQHLAEMKRFRELVAEREAMRPRPYGIIERLLAIFRR
jgi:hypothetical protein